MQKDKTKNVTYPSYAEARTHAKQLEAMAMGSISYAMQDPTTKIDRDSVGVRFMTTHARLNGNPATVPALSSLFDKKI